MDVREESSVSCVSHIIHEFVNILKKDDGS